MRDSVAVGHMQDGESAAAAPALDLAHLSRQTLGDRELALELLTIFDRQAAQFAARLSAPRRPGDGAPRADLAHTLKGSARAVGAFRLGDVAEAYEMALRGGDPKAEAGCAALLDAIATARGAIVTLIETAGAGDGVAR